MTLGRKIILRNVGLLLGVGVLAASALWGLNELRRHVNTAFSESTELKRLSVVGVELNEAKRSLGDGDYERALELLRTATLDLRGTGISDPYHVSNMAKMGQEYLIWDRNFRADLANLADSASERTQNVIDGQKDDSIATALDPAIGRLDIATHECQGFITAAQQSADDVLFLTLVLVGGLSALILICAFMLSQWHYDSVMRPLDRLRQWVRRVDKGDFPPPLEITGDLEFCELAVDVNHMAKALHDFYTQLDEKVRQTSRDLVRSQRLASVGYLAAGVAHEINNPLNIVSGFAELSLNRLNRGFDPNSTPELIRALQVIREEAFRCKEITSKLLSTARGGGEGRDRRSLRTLAFETADAIKGLKTFSDRHIEMRFDQAEPLDAIVNPTELKQVILNLLTNALEAVRPGDGIVTLEGRRQGDAVELAVRDNGRGMAPQVLERVFEPFFTEKRGVGDPGTGLGLCISHAIIENHGGKIFAASEGHERGSVFTIRLPSAAASAAARPPETATQDRRTFDSKSADAKTVEAQ